MTATSPETPATDLVDGPILVVEDEKKIADLLRDYLVAAGFAVEWVDRGDAAVPAVRRLNPRLVLLDLMLPGRDGTDICRDIRAFSRVPVIMVTARVEEVDRVIGLEIGADDYVCKPFSPREVVARVRAVLRRGTPAPDGGTIRRGPLLLEDAARRVSVAGVILKLTPSEYDLLKVLMVRPGQVFSRAQLIRRVQGYDFEGYERTIDSHIKNLRKKIGEILPGANFIESVYGVGYRMGDGSEAE